MSDPADRELPAGWALAPLAEIVQINPGLDTAVEDDATEVNFVPMRAVEVEGGGLVRPERRPYAAVKKGYTPFVAGDVISAKITPCMENGKTTVVPKLPGGLCFGSTEFHVLRPERGIASSWVANFLLRHDVRRAAQRSMGGAVGQMRVPVSFLESVIVPTPPAAEQSRIIEALDELLTDLDSGVASLEAVRAKLALYRASVLKAAVDGSLTADWRTQHRHVEPASELLKRILAERRRRWEEEQLRRFKEKGQEPPKHWKSKYGEPLAPDIAGLGELPATWCWTSLDQLAEIAGGVTKGQKFPENQSTRMVAYLRVANVQRGYLDLKEIKQIRALQSDIDELRLQRGDVLFNEGGDRDKLGRGWIWEDAIEECIHQNHVFRARLIMDAMNPKVVSWCGNSYGQRWFMRTGKQSVNLASINMTVLRSFPVALVPPAEQDAVVEAAEDHLSVIDHLEADLAATLKSTSALRQSILGHAFTGQLVPQDPRDEPASELLKRIAAEREQRGRDAATAKQSKTARRKTGVRRPRRPAKKAAARA